MVTSTSCTAKAPREAALEDGREGSEYEAKYGAALDAGSLPENLHSTAQHSTVHDQVSGCHRYQPARLRSGQHDRALTRPSSSVKARSGNSCHELDQLPTLRDTTPEQHSTAQFLE